MIDVAALDSHNLQQHEYLERMKQYNQKLQQLCVTNKIQYKGKSCILQDVPNPEKILNSDSVNSDDIKLVSRLKKLLFITFDILIKDNVATVHCTL